MWFFADAKTNLWHDEHMARTKSNIGQLQSSKVVINLHRVTSQRERLFFLVAFKSFFNMNNSQLNLHILLREFKGLDVRLKEEDFEGKRFLREEYDVMQGK